jgi:hypothetical protein
MLPHRFFSSDEGIIKRFREKRTRKETNCIKSPVIKVPKHNLGNLWWIIQDDLYTVKVHLDQSFLYSLFRLIVPKHLIVQFHIKIEDCIDCFFENLLIEYDSQDLYKSYKYGKIVSRRDMVSVIMERRINRNFIHLLCDYLSVHIIVNDSESSKLQYYFKGRYFDPYTPIIMMYTNKHKNGNVMYQPLFFKNSSITSSDQRFHWKIYYNYIQPSITRFRFGLKEELTNNVQHIYQMTIKNLRDLSKERDLDIRKVSPITGKRVYKTKVELTEQLA